MLKYTIGFIRRADEILLLNRLRAPWMGCWNGVGGKIEPGEPPLASMLREIREETGLRLDCVHPAGVVLWWVDGRFGEGMYAFTADLPEDLVYPTPRLTREGILDWKPVDWIMDPQNQGVAHNLPHLLPALFSRSLNEFHCHFASDPRGHERLLEVTVHPLSPTHLEDLLGTPRSVP